MFDELHALCDDAAGRRGARARSSSPAPGAGFCPGLDLDEADDAAGHEPARDDARPAALGRRVREVPRAAAAGDRGGQRRGRRRRARARARRRHPPRLAGGALQRRLRAHRPVGRRRRRRRGRCRASSASATPPRSCSRAASSTPTRRRGSGSSTASSPPTRCSTRRSSWPSEIAANTPFGVTLTKRVLNANVDAGSLSQAVEVENRGQTLATRGADFARGARRLPREARRRSSPALDVPWPAAHGRHRVAGHLGAGDGRGRRRRRRGRARRRLGARSSTTARRRSRSPRWRTAPRAARVGTAIAYGVGRSPLTLAAEARDLDELSDGRFVLGLGNGTRRMISDWHGPTRRRRPCGWRSWCRCCAGCGACTRGRSTTRAASTGCSFRPTGELPPPLRERIPIYTAGVNPRMVETAGRVADGLLGHTLFTAGYLAGRGAAGDRARRRARPAATLARRARRARWSSRRSHEDAGAGAARGRRPDRLLLPRRRPTPALLERQRLRRRGRGDPRRPSRRGDLEAMVAAVLRADGRRARRRRHRRRTCAPRLRRYEGLLDHAILYAPSYRLSAGARAREHARADRGGAGVSDTLDGVPALSALRYAPSSRPATPSGRSPSRSRRRPPTGCGASSARAPPAGSRRRGCCRCSRCACCAARCGGSSPAACSRGSASSRTRESARRRRDRRRRVGRALSPGRDHGLFTSFTFALRHEGALAAVVEWTILDPATA